MKLFTDEITAKNAIPLLIYLLFLSVLELLAYKTGGIFSFAASRIWLATALLCFLLFLFAAGQTLLKDIQNRRFLLVAGFFLLLLLFCLKIGSLSDSDVSYEAALQVSAGLTSFEAKDFNYTGVAFLDYANRQYVLNALPALFFGRSVLTLHLGFALPFLTGMTLWYLELRAWLREKEIREEYALFPLYALPVFPYITEYFMNFEQTLTPVTFTMLGLALLLRFYRKRDIPGVLALSWVGGMCCNAYTPVLAFFGFLLVFLALWGTETGYRLKKSLFSPENRTRLWQVLLCFALVLQFCCYFAATMGTEQKSMITTAKPELSFAKALLTSWLDFFLDQQGDFWGIWLFPVLGYLFLALSGMLKFHQFLVAGWMLLTAFFSTWLAGYTVYEKAHEIQRNMLIIPVFITAFFFAAVRFFTKHPVRLRRCFVPATLLLLLLLGQYNFSREHHSFVYYRHIQPMKYVISYTGELLAEQGMSNTEEFHLVLLTDNILMTNLSAYTTFFYPNAHVYTSKQNTYPEGLSMELPTFVFSELPEFPEPFSGPPSSRSFENRRYDSTVTLYCLEFYPDTSCH